MTTTIPEWVKSGNLAHHKPTKTCFVIYQCQRDRISGRCRLLDAPKGESGAEYQLDECEAATPNHFSTVALITVNGKAVSVIRDGTLYVVASDTKKLGVQTDLGMAAAQSLAELFSGTIVASTEVTNHV